MRIGSSHLIGLLVAISISITGCGAIFYENIRLMDNRLTPTTEELLSNTSKSLGYSSCESYGQNHFCNREKRFDFSILNTSENEFEIQFSSYGVPGRQEMARDEFAAYLKQRCPSCDIQIKDHNIWGFFSEDSGWNTF